MDPQAFIRLSIGSLGLRVPMATSKATRGTVHASSSPCLCEIRLQGFPVQTTSVPLILTPNSNPDSQDNTVIFYLEKSDLKTLMAKGCFQAARAYLEIVVYMGRQGSHCGVTFRRRQIGTFRVEVGHEWGGGKPSLLHSGWISIGKSKGVGKPGPELHLRVRLDPDPRYVFQFEDETMLSPQIVQLQGIVKQPIFSCKFIRERRASQPDSMSNSWSYSDVSDQVTERRERKGWKVMIHDLSGSAVAAAFMATPFVPSTGCDRVAQSNPGAWLIVRRSPVGSSHSWHPWGRLEAWRETGPRESVHLRLHLLPEGQDSCLLVSKVMISTEKGGEFSIDMDKHTPVGIPAPTEDNNAGDCDNTSLPDCIDGGFVMNCKVQGERKCSKPLVQLAMRHVTCVEDAAIFIALAAAVDLSMEACRPFRRQMKNGICNLSCHDADGGLQGQG